MGSVAGEHVVVRPHMTLRTQSGAHSQGKKKKKPEPLTYWESFQEG